jgi:hypothetical protein
VVSYFLRYFSSTSTEQISPDSAGLFTSCDPAAKNCGRSEGTGGCQFGSFKYRLEHDWLLA